MVFEFGNLYFNKIYIIQSLRPGDRKTGEELLNDIILRRIKENESAELKNIYSKAELYNYFALIEKSIELKLYPFIHFETHGYSEGIQLTDGSEVSWKELMPHLLRINIISKNNLFISMAACKGGNIQFCIKITEPCPFRGFIGPMEDVDAPDLLNSFNEFFDSLLLGNDFEKAINALNATSKGVTYHHLNAETFFDVVVNYNSDLEKKDPKILNDRIEHLTRELLKTNPNLAKVVDKTILMKWVENYAEDRKPEIFGELKKRFCHIKLSDS